jgi:hypothetical protein
MSTVIGKEHIVSVLRDEEWAKEEIINKQAAIRTCGKKIEEISSSETLLGI